VIDRFLGRLLGRQLSHFEIKLDGETYDVAVLEDDNIIQVWRVNSYIYECKNRKQFMGAIAFLEEYKDGLDVNSLLSYGFIQQQPQV
jgi:hypothetical protein